jgi:hypothetical protein
MMRSAQIFDEFPKNYDPSCNQTSPAMAILIQSGRKHAIILAIIHVGIIEGSAQYLPLWQPQRYCIIHGRAKRQMLVYRYTIWLLLLSVQVVGR